MDNQPTISPENTQNPPSVVSSEPVNNIVSPSNAKPPNSKHAHRFIIGYLILLVMAGLVGGVYYWQHAKVKDLSQKVTSLNTQISRLKSEQSSAIAPKPSTSSSTTLDERARNSKRVTDIKSLQTHLEAFFSQNGYYPSLTDMNSASWRATNMKSLDESTLVDPSNSTSSNTLVVAPTANSFAYAPTDSSGTSCEAKDTTCSKYTLTATYEGTVNGSKTFVSQNLD